MEYPRRNRAGKQGIPAIVLATDDFEKLARFLAGAMGYPDLRLLVIPHPLGGIPEAEALLKADAALKQLVRFFGIEP